MRLEQFAAPLAVPLVYHGLLALVALLKMPHHSSREAVNEDLLAVTGPRLAIISVGADNRFGHPVAQLEGAGIRVLRTDQGARSKSWWMASGTGCGRGAAASQRRPPVERSTGRRL